MITTCPDGHPWAASEDSAVRFPVRGAHRISFSAHTSDHGAHTRVRVFAGATPGSRGMCGVLTMRPEEADAFVARLTRGAL